MLRHRFSLAILTALIVLLVLSALPGAAAGAAEGVLRPFEQDEKWGYKDPRGNVVVEPKYDKARSFCCGLAAVNVGAKVPTFWSGPPMKTGGKCGYIDARNCRTILTSHRDVPLAVKNRPPWGHCRWGMPALQATTRPAPSRPARKAARSSSPPARRRTMSRTTRRLGHPIADQAPAEIRAGRLTASRAGDNIMGSETDTSRSPRHGFEQEATEATEQE